MKHFFKNIQTKMDLLGNGKHPIIINENPKYYLDCLTALAEAEPLPKRMLNKDAFRNSNQHDIITKLRKEIDEQITNRTRLLKTYNDETPQNKVAHWGATFATLSEFFTKYTNEPAVSKFFTKYTNGSTVVIKNAYINKSDYNKIPKRYHSAIKHNGNGYLFVAPKMREMSAVFKDVRTQNQFNQLITKADKLISLIYTETVIVRICDDIEHKDRTYEDKNILGAMPSCKNKFQQKLVTDEQISAIKKLRDIFEEINELVVFVKHKSNAIDAVWEYAIYENKQNSFLRAQRHIRTVYQTVVSARKNADLFPDNYISKMEYRYLDTRNTIKNAFIRLHQKVYM